MAKKRSTKKAAQPRTERVGAMKLIEQIKGQAATMAADEGRTAEGRRQAAKIVERCDLALNGGGSLAQP